MKTEKQIADEKAFQEVAKIAEILDKVLAPLVRDGKISAVNAALALIGEGVGVYSTIATSDDVAGMLRRAADAATRTQPPLNLVETIRELIAVKPATTLDIVSAVQSVRAILDSGIRDFGKMATAAAEKIREGDTDAGLKLLDDFVRMFPAEFRQRMN